MIITIDGTDGCGKSTLAEMLCKKYNFIHIKKPIDDLLHVKNKKSIRAGLSRSIQKLVYDINKNENIKVKFNCSLLLHFKNALENKNAIIERGPLSCYLFNGRDETDSIFEYYTNKKGIKFDFCIYLKASKETRLNRLRTRNPFDVDLKTEKVLNLNKNENRTLEFAKRNKFNICIIETDNLTIEEVFNQACKAIDDFLETLTPNKNREL